MDKMENIPKSPSCSKKEEMRPSRWGNGEGIYGRQEMWGNNKRLRFAVCNLHREGIKENQGPKIKSTVEVKSAAVNFWSII